MGFVMKKCLLLIAVAVIILQLNHLDLYAQITYNVSKPLSYKVKELTSISGLPVLNFTVDAIGNANYTNLAQDINSQFLIEKYSGKNIARLKFKVSAKSLGEMSLIFRNVKLKNGSHCYVYTNDYRIIAGPIYEKSINGNLPIMKLPASELILEVIYDNASDISFTFNGISFTSLIDLSETNKKKEGNQILGDYDNCHDCDYGEVKHADNVMNCGWYGHGNDNEIFKLTNLHGINEYSYNASRSACLIMAPRCEELVEYRAEQGTLMNFPYEDCSAPYNTCGTGFIFSLYHIGIIQEIVRAQDSNDYEFLNNVLIRFNWHHEYGFPWHLQNVECEEGLPSESLWRSTINFNEVIDYCGVEVFAYSDATVSSNNDLTILKMKQRPFYKEHHLGWTTQAKFDATISGYNQPLIANNKEDFKGVGRRGPKPTMLITNHEVIFEPDGGPSEPFGFGSFEIGKYVLLDSTLGDSFPHGWPDSNGYSGYSATQITFTDYVDSEQRIGLGLIKGGEKNRPYRYARSVSYHKAFYVLDNYRFMDSCYDTFSKMRHYFDYIEAKYPLNTITYSYQIFYPFDQVATFDTTNTWYPSMDNKQKCSSNIGRDSTGAYTHICDFDITTYLSYSFDETLCITINSIPTNLFPENKLPRGYRVYHNFGEQRTIAFDTFADGLDIEFPIEVCIDRCYMLYLMSIGKENMNIAIDFYDYEGKILNNPGCDSLVFNIDFPPLCDMLDVSITPAGEEDDCCKYDVTISVEKCPAHNPGWGEYFNDLVEKLSFQTFEDEYSVPLSSFDPGVNTSGDFVTISFSFTICSDLPENEPLVIISYDNGLIKCDIDSLTFDLCSICDCPDESIMASWVTLTTVAGEAPCGDDQCKVVAFIDIPDLYNDSCYTHYAFNNHDHWNFFKKDLMPDGSLQFQNPNDACLEKGEHRQDTLYLYKGRYDENPCTIITSAFCSVESFIEPCSPDCLEVEWNKDTLDFEVAECPGCRIYATYLWRENTCENPTLQELQVTSFATHGDTLACMSCLGLTPDRINKLVILQAIHENKMGFKPHTPHPSGDCYTTWRVLQASCWAKVYTYIHYSIDIAPSYIYIPCDSVECCSIGLRVCRFLDPNDKPYITTQTIGSVIGADSCEHHTQILVDPTSPWVFVPDGPGGTGGYLAPNYKTYQCEDRCSALYSLDTNSYYGSSAKSIINFDVDNIEFDGIQVTLNKTNDYIEFVIHALQDNNNLKLSLYSLLGEELIRERLKFPKGMYSFKLNTSGLYSGMYLISIESNGMHIQTDKYLKIK
jgi:hypothetical protein